MTELAVQLAGLVVAKMAGSLPSCSDHPGCRLVLKADISWSLFVYIFFTGKPKLRTNLNVGPNLLLEWLHLGRETLIKKNKQPNPFSKIPDESLFSVVRRKLLLFVVENSVLISKIIYKFQVCGKPS